MNEDNDTLSATLEMIKEKFNQAIRLSHLIT